MKKFLVFLILFISLIQIAGAVTSVQFYFNTSEQNDSSSTYPASVQSRSVLVTIFTDKETNCKYSTSKGTPYDSMTGTFDFNFETIHKKTFSDLIDGPYRYYIRCRTSQNENSAELEINFNVNLPPTAKIELEQKSPLRAGEYEIKLTASKILAQPPTLAYSLDGSSYDQIPLEGSEKIWKGYLIVEDSTGEKAGSFKFTGRDLEGLIGEEITSGGIFLVDTVKPEAVSDITATGKSGEIELEWECEEDAKEFKIYRSIDRNVERTDYYKSTTGKTYTDDDVDSGKTYFYRISVVDEAENEGALSKEVSTTALLHGSTPKQNGLPIELYGKVDNLLTRIDSVAENIKQAKNGFADKAAEIKEAYDYLQLNKDADAALNELAAIRREVQEYKEQSLTSVELDKKLSADEIKINAAKKKVAESIAIISKKETTPTSDSEEISNLLRLAYSDYSEDELAGTIQKSIQAGKSSEFAVKRKLYSLTIIYLSGDTKEVSLIKEELQNKLSENTNLTILESIPENIASSVSEVNMITPRYVVKNENTLFGFAPDTREIVYMISKKVDEEAIQDIQTILIDETKIEDKTNGGITGYFAFVNVNNMSQYWGMIVGAVVIGVLAVYLFYIKKTAPTQKVAKIHEELFLAKKLLEKGEINKAQNIYNELTKSYTLLNAKEKTSTFPEIQDLYNRLKIT